MPDPHVLEYETGYLLLYSELQNAAAPGTVRTKERARTVKRTWFLVVVITYMKEIP